MKKVLLVVIGIIIGLSAYGLFDVFTKPEVKTYPIVDKYEILDNCFLLIEVQVSPEEFIGYDIGDEYAERGEEK